ncbi:Hypothetical predicted protein, partial [Olea europaea subsp. europaea]
IYRMRIDNKHERDLSVPETKAMRCVFITPPMLKLERGLRKKLNPSSARSCSSKILWKFSSSRVTPARVVVRLRHLNNTTAIPIDARPRVQDNVAFEYPDEKFCKDQVYSDTLERDRRILVELNLLFSTMKKIGEEVIDLADVKGVE